MPEGFTFQTFALELFELKLDGDSELLKLMLEWIKTAIRLTLYYFFIINAPIFLQIVLLVIRCIHYFFWHKNNFDIYIVVPKINLVSNLTDYELAHYFL